MIREIDIHTFAQAHKDGAFVVDVRQPDEYESGHVPGAKNIPLSHLPHRVHELPKDRDIHVICASGGRSMSATQFLHGAGHRALSVAGGTSSWIRAGKPVIRGSRENVA
ncbi:MAG: rhodanese-like domain-containing protein [Ferrimicrobium sp.]